MMKVGFVGCGEMGEPMAGHVLKSGKFEVEIFDVRPAATRKIAKQGAKVAKSMHTAWGNDRASRPDDE